MPPFKPRIHVLLASQAPLGVVIRRGPSKQVCTILWDRSTDQFQLGQWLKGRIYPEKSDLSPDGKYLIYFALNGKWREEAQGAWTAISRVPYLTAIALYPEGETWYGGGIFTSGTTFWLNHAGGPPLRETKELTRDRDFQPFRVAEHGVPNVYETRLIRDGWTKVPEAAIERRDTGRLARLRTFLIGFWQSSRPDSSPNSGLEIHEKPLLNGWLLRKQAHSSEQPTTGKSWGWEDHELIHRETGRLVPCPDWEWADLDGERVVWISDGKLHAANLADIGLINHRTLHDFNGMTFEPIKAPY